MSFWFGDGFDCYALFTDATLGYWDAGSGGELIATGRFSGSRAWRHTVISAVTAGLQKSSGSNDAVHHLTVAIYQTTAIASTNNYNWFTLSDGTTAQCSIVFRSDGAILLNSGGASGTTLATYTGALTATATWYVFEIEVVINNTSGSIAVRKNGNTSNDFSATSLNTRGGTANNYANRLTTGNSTSSGSQWIDDLLWRSDTSSVPWVGDIRCYTRRPDTDAAAAWTRPSTFQMQPYTGTTGTTTLTSGSPRYSSFITQGGTIGGIVLSLTAGSTANVKCTIFASSGGVPGAILQSSTAPLNNPVSGTNTFTFSPPVSIAKGTQVFVGIVSDATVSGVAFGNIAPYTGMGFSATQSYASFPTSNPAMTSATNQFSLFPVVTPTYNADAVADSYEDATASYVYSSAPGAQDLYTLTGISSTPSTVIGVTTRGLLTKSDAGTRLAAVQLRSGATTVQSAGALSSSAWGWLWRSDTTDPATGAAWTVSGVAAAQIGAQVTG